MSLRIRSRIWDERIPTQRDDERINLWEHDSIWSILYEPRNSLPVWQIWNPVGTRRVNFTAHIEPPEPTKKLTQSTFRLTKTKPAYDPVKSTPEYKCVDHVKRIEDIIDRVMQCGHGAFKLEGFHNEPFQFRIICADESCRRSEEFYYRRFSGNIGTVIFDKIAKDRGYTLGEDRVYIPTSKKNLATDKVEA